jgi:hypothetical protein
MIAGLIEVLGRSRSMPASQSDNDGIEHSSIDQSGNEAIANLTTQCCNPRIVNRSSIVNPQSPMDTRSSA